MTDNDTPLESTFLTRSLEQAQEKVELYNYEIRKNVFQYDEIINSQRKQLFQIRKATLSSDIYNELSLRYAEFTFDEKFISLKNEKDKLMLQLEKSFPYFNKIKKSFNISNTSNLSLEMYPEIWISNDLRLAQGNFYQVGFFQNTQNQILLSIIDFYWTDHIERMDYIRDTINWRSYGQQNPLIEYNTEACKSYKLMLEQIRLSMLYYFLENPILNFN
jgi:preprotein translocase subunit SecA